MTRDGCFDRPGRTDPGTLPAAAAANWLAGGLHAVAAVLALLSGPRLPSMAIFGAAYGAGLAAGTWLVRPAERGRRVFTWLMAPLVLQAAIYVLYWYPLAAAALSGDDAVATFETPGQRAAFQAAVAALALGWVPSLMLRTLARQARLLVIVQFLGPGAAVVFQVLAWVGI